MDDLPARLTTCRTRPLGRRYLLRFFLEVRKNVGALLRRSEQARNGAPESSNRYLPALGFHRASNRVRTAVENFSAREPAGVR